MIGEPSYGALLPVCSGEDIKFRKSVSSSSTTVMTAETPTGGKNVTNNKFMNEPLYTWIINTFRSLPYLKLAVESIRENAYYKNQPILVYTENDTETG